MGINGLMQFLRKKLPSVFHSTPHHKINGTAYVDTPLITMSCGMVAQSSRATIDPYSLVKSKLETIEHLLKQHGAKKVIFVFDGPTRKEKIETCIKRAELIRKQSEKRKREPLPIYRIEESEASEHVQDQGTQESEHFMEEGISEEEEALIMASPRSAFSIFPDVTEDHCIESDLYISSMIAHGADTFVLKDLARFAKYTLGDKAIVAPHDSESFIAARVKDGDIGVTCDSDALPFGCEWIVQNLGSAKETWIKLEDVLSGLHLTLDEFRIFCVLLGTDFNQRLYLCGPSKCYPLLFSKSFKGFEHFCSLYGKKYSQEEKILWIKSAEDSLNVFSSEKKSIEL